MVFFLILALTVVPILLGALFVYPIKKEENENFAFLYVAGFVFMLALFQVLCIPFMVFQAKLHELVWTYSILLGGLSALSLWLNRKKIKAYKLEKRTISGYWIIALALISLQIITSVVLTPEYAHSGDDTTYIAMANDAVESDTIYLVDYMTGKEGSLSEVSPKYTLTSYIIFTSYLAKLSGLHVLIVCKSILPIVVIAVAYMIWGLTGSYFFHRDSEKTALFLILMSVLNLFGGFSNYTLSFRLLVCSWQGKALMAVVALPFLFYYALKVLQTDGGKWEWGIIFITMIASASGSLFGNGLAPMMLMGLTAVNVFMTKKWKQLIPAALCCAPNALFLLIYLKYTSIISFIGQL